MIRPEIVTFFTRYAEVIAGGLLAILGIWIVTSSSLFWSAIGIILAIIGGGWAGGAWRRIRLSAQDHDGPGVVEVDERQITYFAPYEGGAVSINDLARVTILTTDKGPAVEDVHWLLEENGGGRLVIPNSAEGADQLFDALAPLKGVDFDTAIKAMGSTANASFVIWAKQRAQLH
ncbi:hypothetical protein C8N43_3747 [Litoreibacter ponti]|uniref:Uncharacterized protein n=1 Tax=Litoreibacter ponti TaxID=1510457 RepID=A0A2T6BFT7_9RHOB|nr:hypothetical protein [Litoreibacter ponti]PTX54924.1 hypothetical protein C8N43_3747 [Litoreibacter ponti]